MEELREKLAELEHKQWESWSKYVAENNKIPIIGKIPYRREFLDASLQMRPFVDLFPEYKEMFYQILNDLQ